MTVYTDAAGISYIGDVQYGNWSVQTPNFNYPLSRTATGMNTDLTQLLTNITSNGGSFSDVISDALLDNIVGNTTLFRWTPEGDTTAHSTSKRFRAYWDGFRIRVTRFNDAGTAAGELIEGIGSWYSELELYPKIPAQYVVSASPSFIFFTVFYTNSTSTLCNWFFINRIPDGSLNTNFNYYSANEVNRSIFAGTSGDNGAARDFYHWINNFQYSTLRTGDAAYSIACSDEQTPGGQWATDLYVFDTNATLGYPSIGKLSGSLKGIGFYTFGKPVKLQGTAKPNNGFNTYLPIHSHTSGTTCLYPCYSSVV